MKFIGRENELKRLSDALHRPYGSVVALYGRRRVGKSALIAKALEDFSGTVISFVALDRAGYQKNFELLKNKVKTALKEEFLDFKSISDLLSFLYVKAKESPMVLVLDEYPFFLEGHEELNSELQTVIDQYQKDSHLHIILSGSSFGKMRQMMEDPSPLYGRFNEILHIDPFDYWDSAKWMGDLSAEKKFEFYAVFGGIPYYLDNLDFTKSLKENLIEKFIPIGSFFENELQNTALKEIMKDERSFRIVSLIAQGKHTYSDLNETLPGKGASKAVYALSKLTDEKIIQRLTPINLNSERKGSYYLCDSLLEFYFGFLYEMQTERTYMSAEAVYDMIQDSFLQNYLPHQFEKLAKEYLIRRNRMGLNQPLFKDIGHFAYCDLKGKKNLEFDVVTNSDQGYENYECKYLSHPLSQQAMEKEIRDCKERDIPFARYGFFSKNGFEIKPDGVDCYSLDDIYRLEDK